MAEIAGDSRSNVDAGATASGSGKTDRPCAPCREARVLCDKFQPCGRCIKNQRVHLCVLPPVKKIGRPSAAERMAKLEHITTDLLTNGFVARDESEAVPMPDSDLQRSKRRRMSSHTTLTGPADLEQLKARMSVVGALRRTAVGLTTTSLATQTFDDQAPGSGSSNHETQQEPCLACCAALSLCPHSRQCPDCKWLHATHTCIEQGTPSGTVSLTNPHNAAVTTAAVVQSSVPPDHTQQLHELRMKLECLRNQLREANMVPRA